MPVLPHLPPQLSQWLRQRVGQGLLFFVFFLMSFQPVLFLALHHVADTMLCAFPDICILFSSCNNL